jgi:acyl-CoA synthetase (AMP-forming)/AMP-acid ligase II
MNSGPILSKIVQEAARRFADRTCLIDGSRQWTFGEFDLLCESLATGLLSEFRPGDRVALFMSNRAEYLMLQIAIERAGLVRVPVNARSTEHDVCQILADCGAAVMFCDAATSAKAGATGIDIPVIHVDDGPNWPALLATPGKPALLHLSRYDDLCSINYTSGTSGRPKGVMMNHRQWLAVTRNMLVDRDIRMDDTIAHIGPLTHASGTYFIPWFLRGAVNLIVPGGSIEGLFHAIEYNRATVFTCVPTVLTRIVNHPAVDQVDFSSVRAIGYGAEPIPQSTLERAVARFGNIVTQNYGQTEALMTVSLLHPSEHFLEDGSLRIGSIGRPYRFVEVVLRAEDGAPVATNEMGEITVRSDHVMMGYWNMPDETENVLRNGWLWTGDLARQDENGYLYLMGRSKDMLISGGHNIYPAEVEAIITSQPQVIEAAVIGVPDPHWGEICVAHIVMHPDAAADEAALGNHCKALLGFRAPKRYLFVPDLPKNSNGKIDKKLLKEQFVATNGG